MAQIRKCQKSMTEERGLFSGCEEETERLLRAEDPHYRNLCHRLVHFADVTSDEANLIEGGQDVETGSDDIASLRTRLTHSEAVIAALRQTGDCSNNNSQLPENTPLVDALALDFRRLNHDNGTGNRHSSVSADNILSTGALDCDGGEFVEGVWQQDAESSSCPHLPPPYLTAVTDTCKTKESRRAPHLANHRQSVYNTSTGSSTSGVEVSSVSSRSDYLLPPALRSSNRNVMIIETASTPPGDATDLSDPLSRYRRASFKQAIERGQSGDSSNQSFETYDPPSTSSDISPEHVSYPYLTVTDRLDHNYISHKLNNASSRGRRAKKHKQTEAISTPASSSFVSTVQIHHDHYTTLPAQHKAHNQDKKTPAESYSSTHTGGVDAAYGGDSVLAGSPCLRHTELHDPHCQFPPATQSGRDQRPNSGTDASDASSGSQAVLSILRNHRSLSSAGSTAEPMGQEGQHRGLNVDASMTESMDDTDSPNRSRRLSTLVEEECSEADGDENRSGRLHHLTSKAARSLSLSSSSSHKTSPAQGMPLKRWVLSPPTPPKYKDPPPYTEALSTESSPTTSHREIRHISQRSRSLSPSRKHSDCEFKNVSGPSTPPISRNPRTGKSRHEGMDCPSNFRHEGTDCSPSRHQAAEAVRNESNVSYIGRTRRKSLKENRKQKIKDADSQADETFSEATEDSNYQQVQTTAERKEIEIHAGPCTGPSETSREPAEEPRRPRATTRSLIAGDDAEDDVFDCQKRADTRNTRLTSDDVTVPSLCQYIAGSGLPLPAASREPVLAGNVKLKPVSLNEADTADTHPNAAVFDTSRKSGSTSGEQLERIKQENLARKRNLSKQIKMPELSETSETESARGALSNESVDSETEAGAAVKRLLCARADSFPCSITNDQGKMTLAPIRIIDESDTPGIDKRCTNFAEKKQNPMIIHDLEKSGINTSEEVLRKDSCQEAQVFPSLPDKVLSNLGLLSNPDGSSLIEQLSEQEVEEKFARVSLAFKTDKLTLDKRIERHKRARDIMEQNIEAEIHNLKDALKAMSGLCSDKQSRDVYSQIQQHVDVLEQSSNRMASRAELLGAVQQEMRISQAIEVMVQHVENLKRLHEKEHIELEETKKLLLENKIPSTSEGGDGGRRLAMLGSALGAKVGRRRASVAVLSANNRPLLPTTTTLNSNPLLDLDAISRVRSLANSSASAFRRASQAASSNHSSITSFLPTLQASNALLEAPDTPQTTDSKQDSDASSMQLLTEKHCTSTSEITAECDSHDTSDAGKTRAERGSLSSDDETVLPAISVTPDTNHTGSVTPDTNHTSSVTPDTNHTSSVTPDTNHTSSVTLQETGHASSHHSRSRHRSSSPRNYNGRDHSPRISPRRRSLSARRSSSTEKDALNFNNSAIARDMFRKGFEVGLNACVRGDLSGLDQEQQDIENLLNRNTSSDEATRTSLTERVRRVLPSWQKIQQSLRFSIASVLLVLAVVCLIVSMFPSSVGTSQVGSSVTFLKKLLW